jgi:sugar/nucleoside kinase (ribokinase family)
LGFDGFVDEITYVVDLRESADSYTRIRTLSAFGDRISRAAGKSANVEYVTVMTKMGGNGTIMANAMSLLGVDLSCIGTMGSPEPHPVYAALWKRAHAVSLGNPARTEALEFDDGKLITSKLEALNEVTWERIIECYPLRELIKGIDDCILFAPMNWTMLPHMGDILGHLALIVVPELSRDRKRYLYVDFADPEKRPATDLARTINTLTKFTRAFQVVVGANSKELSLICAACGAPAGDDLQDADRARWLINNTGFAMVVVHAREHAMCVRRGGETSEADALFTPEPMISTGAGDNFNAGFCYGLMSGMPDEACLAMGCAVSGYYVRNAKSPDRYELEAFLRER